MVSPLTDADLDQINARLEDLDRADEIIRRANAAGLDIGDQADQSKDARRKLQGIKDQFFPNR